MNLSPQGQLMRDDAADAAAAAGGQGDAGAGGAGDAAAAQAQADAAAAAAASAGTWKSSVRPDLRDSPLLSKFEDNAVGLNKALESHANLEKLLGHDKVPIPKDDNDREGWARFNKAMGVPDTAEAYGLPDVKLPDSMKGMSIDKAKFAEVVRANSLTPKQANTLWKTYNDIQVTAYNSHLETLQANLTKTINMLKQDWGAAYATNVELGQSVINQFSDDKDMNDYLTSVLSSDPKGLRFLKKLGDQFAENKVGDFNVKRFAVTPEEAQAEVDKMVHDIEGPYMNQKGKFTDKEHAAAIERVNSLRTIINRSRG